MHLHIHVCAAIPVHIHIHVYACSVIISEAFITQELGLSDAFGPSMLSWQLGATGKDAVHHNHVFHILPGSKLHVWIESLGKGSLPRPTGPVKGNEGPTKGPLWTLMRAMRPS